MLLPSRDDRDISFYEKRFEDGRYEISAFFNSTISGWRPMIAVWAIDQSDPTNDSEDQISINGMHFAYCISDEKPTDFEGLVAIDDPSDVPSSYALAIGILTNRVI